MTQNYGVPPHRRRNLISSQEDHEVQSKRIQRNNNQQHLESRRRHTFIQLIVYGKPFLWHISDITGHQRMQRNTEACRQCNPAKNGNQQKDI
jgi:hypothetical protein